MSSFKIEVSTNGGKSFASNALRFATEAEAAAAGAALAGRWLAVTDHRTAHSDSAVNYEFVDGQSRRLIIFVSA